MLLRTTLAVLVATLLSVSSPRANAGDFGVWFGYGGAASRCYDYTAYRTSPVLGYVCESWDYDAPTYVGCLPGPVVIYEEAYPVYRTTYTRSACFTAPRHHARVSVHVGHRSHHYSRHVWSHRSYRTPRFSVHTSSRHHHHGHHHSRHRHHR